MSYGVIMILILFLLLFMRVVNVLILGSEFIVTLMGFFMVGIVFWCTLNVYIASSISCSDGLTVRPCVLL